MKRYCYRLVFLLILLFSFSFAATYQGDWNGSAKWLDGWSDWNFTSTGYENEISMTVYLPVAGWSDRQITGNSGSASSITIPGESGCMDGNHKGTCTVRVYDGDHTWCSSYVPPYDDCANYNDRLNSCSGRCDCALGSVETGYCISSGYYCAGNPTVVHCGANSKATIRCRFFRGGEKVSGGGYCDGYSTEYYYRVATSYYTNKENWRRSLSEAGGYARKVYIYSYPQKVYINYNGNGANGTCGTWKTNPGSNNVNSNRNIVYSLGNPVCQSGQTVNGSMPSGENVAISWTGGNLNENKFYRNGYDFKGWSLTPGGAAEYADKAYLNGNTFGGIGKNPGSTLTLYAVWEKHSYKVEYQYYCGTKATDIYKYGEGITSIDNLDVRGCNTDEKSGTDGGNANTEFVGWFLDTGLTNRITSIPSNWWSDVTLYGQVKQSRYYDYSRDRWDWYK